MSRRLLAPFLPLSLALAVTADAEAANGSNYIHLINGIDYFFSTSAYTGAPGLRGAWRCFPSEVLHSPTLVTDPANPAFGTYASKVCAVHFNEVTSAGSTMTFPNLTLSTSDGRCHLLRSAGTGWNFGLASTGAATGFAVVGPLSGHGAPATISGTWTIPNITVVNVSGAPNIILSLTFLLDGSFGGLSSVPVPDGDGLTLWLADATNQTGPGLRHYFTGSFDERNLCSGYSFLLSGGSLGAVTSFGFSPAWEFAMGIGTIDATMTNIVTVGASGAGPSGLNAHTSTTAFAQPFDQGSGALTVSVTGTTPFAFTSSTSEFLGFATYDENNVFGGSDRIVMTDIWRYTADGSTHCVNGAAQNPALVTLPTGGPGGPVLSTLGNQPRSVARCDTLAMALLANPATLNAMRHGTTPGGLNVPWFPAAAGSLGLGISGSTGNNGGAVIPIPPLPALVGIQLFSSSLALNASGTAIAKLANDGHSHSNGSALTFFP